MHIILQIIIWLAIWGIVFYVLWWGLAKMALPEPFNKIGTIVLVVATILVVLNPLFGFMPGPVIRWG